MVEEAHFKLLRTGTHYTVVDRHTLHCCGQAHIELLRTGTHICLVRLPEPWNYYLSFDIYFINLSKILRAQEFQGSGVATPLEWLLEKLKAFSQLLVILGSYSIEN